MMRRGLPAEKIHSSIRSTRRRSHGASPACVLEAFRPVVKRVEILVIRF